MNIYTEIIKKKNLESDLFNFFNFDSDMNGDRGEGFTNEEAVKQEVTDIELIIKNVKAMGLGGRETIEYVAEKVASTYRNHFEVECRVKTVDLDTYTTGDASYILTFVAKSL